MPSFRCIARTDFLTLVALLAPLVALVVAAVVGALGLPRVNVGRVLLLSRDAAEVPRWELARIAIAMSGVFAVLGALVAAWRVRAIRRAFAGRRVEGVITRIVAFDDRAYVHYEHDSGGAPQRHVHFVHLSASTRRLVEGQRVTLAFDRDRPSRAFIVEAFE
ncbi:hypothetical protein [Sorangium sp. So ce1000]|uniref:hypothetical protein n=1 Tax=Sorangium sp. So ce1000 TaxID=3133325 RepID=UPI003F63BDB9